MPETLFVDPEHRSIPIDQLLLIDDNVGPVDQDAVDQLAASIAEVGVLQPLVVTENPDGEGFTVVLGRHRFLAACEVELDQVPCIVRGFDDEADRDLAMLVENLHRRSIDPISEGRAYARLVKNGLKQRDLADKVGRSQSHVSKRVALTKLPEAAQAALVEGRLTTSLAEELAKVRDREQVARLFKEDRPVRDWEINELVRRQERQERVNEFRKECLAEGLIEVEGADWWQKYEALYDDDDDLQPTHFNAEQMHRLVVRDDLDDEDLDEPGPAPADETDEERAAREELEARFKAEREERERREAEKTAARDAQHAFVRQALASKLDQKAAQELVNSWLVHIGFSGYVEFDTTPLIELLELKIPEDADDTWKAEQKAIDAFAAVSPSARLKVLVAAIYTSESGVFPCLTWRPNGDGLDPNQSAYVDWLRAAGYEFSAFEQAELHRITTPVVDEAEEGEPGE